MKDNKGRKSIRLPNYDYSQSGAYFITICTWQRQCTLGNIVSDGMILNEFGNIVIEEWRRSAEIRKEINLDEFIVMPNHIHGIVIIKDSTMINENDKSSIENHKVGATGWSPLPPQIQHPGPLPNTPITPRKTDHHVRPKGPRPQSIGSFVAGYKSAVTTRINRLRLTPGMTFWQRNYYEHVIRDEKSLQKYRKYIVNNPIRWASDKENPNNL